MKNSPDSASPKKAPRLNGYETIVLTRLDMAETAVKALHDKLVKVIESFNGQLVLSEDWGKRKLAYLIEKQPRAHYTYMVYTGAPEVVAELERQLKLQEQVMRYLTVKLDDYFDPEAFVKRREELNQAAKRREEEREQHRERVREERRDDRRDDRRESRHHEAPREAHRE